MNQIVNMADELERLKQDLKRLAKASKECGDELVRQGLSHYSAKQFGRSEAYSMAAGKITRLQRLNKVGSLSIEPSSSSCPSNSLCVVAQSELELAERIVAGRHKVKATDMLLQLGFNRTKNAYRICDLRMRSLGYVRARGFYRLEGN